LQVDVPADTNTDFFTVQRPIDPDPTHGSNESLGSKHSKSFALRDRPFFQPHGRTDKAYGKKIVLTAALLAIASGCAVYAWVEGQNVKASDLFSAQPLLANTRSQPPQATEGTTQKSVVAAALPRPPTKRHTARRIVSEPTNGHTDLIEPQASAND